MKTQESAFTLIEVLISMTLFLIVSAIMTPSFISRTKYNNASEVKNGAISSVQQVLESLRTTDPAILPTSGSSPEETITIGDKIFKVTKSYCVNPTYCTVRTRHVSVGVKHLGKQVYKVDTVFTKLK